VFDTSEESRTGVAPVTGAANPVTPADVIGVSAGAAVAGKVTVNVRVLPAPVPETMPALAVPVFTAGVIEEVNVYPDAEVRTTAAVYDEDAANALAAGVHTMLVTVYCDGAPGASKVSDSGAAPVTGATNPETPAEVIAVAAGTAVVGEVMVKVSVLPVPVPDTIPSPAVPAFTVGVNEEEKVYPVAEVSMTVAVYVVDEAKVVAAGDQTILVTVY